MSEINIFFLFHEPMLDEEHCKRIKWIRGILNAYREYHLATGHPWCLIERIDIENIKEGDFSKNLNLLRLYRYAEAMLALAKYKVTKSEQYWIKKELGYIRAGYKRVNDWEELLKKFDYLNAEYQKLFHQGLLDFSVLNDKL